MVKFYRIVDREPERPELSNNGGDYREGRTVAVEDNRVLAVRFWSSWDGDFCHKCGRYGQCDCENVPVERDWNDWRDGELLTGWDEELALSRFQNNGFALIEPVAI